MSADGNEQSLWLTVKEFMTTIVEEFKNTHVAVKIAILVSVIIYAGSVILSVRNILIAQKMFFEAKMSNGDIVNEQSVEYVFANTYNSFVHNGFNIVYSLVLPWLQILPFIGLGVYYWRNREKEDINIGGVYVTICIFLLLVQSVISIVFNYLLYYYIHDQLKSIKYRIDDFNTFVKQNLYISDTFIAFYTPLAKPQANQQELMNTVAKSLKTIPKNVTSDQLSKALFTINLYSHFHKLGYRHASLMRAVHLFNHTTVLRTKFGVVFSPSDYLFKKGVFIEDISDEFMNAQNGYLDASITSNPEFVQDVLIKSSSLVEQANNKANSIFADDAFNLFVWTSTAFILVQGAVIILILWIARNGTHRFNAT
jgi:hypothetical protein